MITLKELEMLETQSVDDIDINKLVDITSITIDDSKSEIEKTLSFIEKVKNPYLFRVGKIPVRIRFKEGAPTLQERLEKLLINNK